MTKEFYRIVRALGLLAALIALLYGLTKAQHFNDAITRSETAVESSRTEANKLEGQVDLLKKTVADLQQTADLLQRVGGVNGLKEKLALLDAYQKAFERAQANSRALPTLRPVPSGERLTALRVTVQPSAANQWVKARSFGDPNHGDKYRDGQNRPLVASPQDIAERVVTTYSADHIDAMLAAVNENLKATVEYAAATRPAAVSTAQVDKK
jgi:hypothetical protein